MIIIPEVTPLDGFLALLSTAFGFPAKAPQGTKELEKRSSGTNILKFFLGF